MCLFVSLCGMNDKIVNETDSVRVSKDRLARLREYSEFGGLRQLMDEAIDEKLEKLRKLKEFKESLR